MPEKRIDRPSDPGRSYVGRASRRYRTESYYRDGAIRVWPMQIAVLQGLLDRPRGIAKSREDCTNAALPHAARIRGYEPSWWGLYDTISILARRGWVRRKRVGRCIRISLTPRGRAIVNGEVVARFFGGELYLPGRRLSKAPSNEGTVVALGHGIDLVIPKGWTTNFVHVNEAVAEGRQTVNAALRRLGSQGIMLTASPHDKAGGSPALTLMLLPTGLSQEACAAMTDATIARLDAELIRPEVDEVAREKQFTVTCWGGTTRAVVGGRIGLVTRYAFGWPNGSRYRKETHVAYLSRKQLVAHLYLPPHEGGRTEAGVRSIHASLRILTATL